MIKWLVIFTITILFSGCTADNSKNASQQTVSAETQVTGVTATTYIISEGVLKQIEVGQAKVAAEYTLPSEFAPITFTYGKTFTVSIDGEYVVWYVPDQGLVRLNKQDKSVEVFYKPTEWFKENPYFQFYGDTDTVVLIDKRGSEIVWVDLKTLVVKSTPVPYPFGTIFSISPDLHKVLYVEGYRQTVGEPSYLVTDTDGNTITKFKTNAEIADRSMVVWDKDSSAVITVENSNTLVRYPLDNPEQPTVLVEIQKGETIVQLEQLGSVIFIGSKSAWYAFDLESNKLTNKLPLEAVSQLHRPRFISLSRTHFYIEEDVRSYDQFFKRLWVSDWVGNKTIVVPEYGKRVNQVNAY